MEQNVRGRAHIEIRMPQARAPLGKLIIPKRLQAQRDMKGVALNLRHLTCGALYGESKEIDLQEHLWH